MNAAVGAAHRLALREDVLSVDDEEFGRLLEALTRLDRREAEARRLGPALSRLASVCVDADPSGEGRPA